MKISTIPDHIDSSHIALPAIGKHLARLYERKPAALEAMMQELLTGRTRLV